MQETLYNLTTAHNGNIYGSTQCNDYEMVKTLNFRQSAAEYPFIVDKSSQTIPKGSTSYSTAWKHGAN